MDDYLIYGKFIQFCKKIEFGPSKINVSEYINNFTMDTLSEFEIQEITKYLGPIDQVKIARTCKYLHQVVHPESLMAALSDSQIQEITKYLHFIDQIILTRTCKRLHKVVHIKFPPHSLAFLPSLEEMYHPVQITFP